MHNDKKKLEADLFENKNEIRLNKFLSDAGFCSRREADRLIEAGKVFVDGQATVMGQKIKIDQTVTVNNKKITYQEKLILIALNKPKGIECTTDSKNKDNIVDFVDYNERIYPVGRLDKDSHGLILMTNDGTLGNSILRAANFHEKEYVVTVNKLIDNEFIHKMENGVPILNTVTRPCTVIKEGKYKFRIIITQGLNRQIRRMCEFLGYKVVDLKRVRILNIKLGRLKEGQYRNVSYEEIDILKSIKNK